MNLILLKQYDVFNTFVKDSEKLQIRARMFLPHDHTPKKGDPLHLTVFSNMAGIYLRLMSSITQVDAAMLNTTVNLRRRLVQLNALTINNVLSA